jgi:hypothetical protein
MLTQLQVSLQNLKIDVKEEEYHYVVTSILGIIRRKITELEPSDENYKELLTKFRQVTELHGLANYINNNRKVPESQLELTDMFRKIRLLFNWKYYPTTAHSSECRCVWTSRLLKKDEPAYLVVLYYYNPKKKPNDSEHEFSAFYISHEQTNPELYLIQLISFINLSKYKLIIRNEVDDWIKQNKAGSTEDNIEKLSSIINDGKFIFELIKEFFILKNYCDKLCAI